jgi:hypothetical protein
LGLPLQLRLRLPPPLLLQSVVAAAAAINPRISCTCRRCCGDYRPAAIRYLGQSGKAESRKAVLLSLKLESALYESVPMRAANTRPAPRWFAPRQPVAVALPPRHLTGVSSPGSEVSHLAVLHPLGAGPWGASTRCRSSGKRGSRYPLAALVPGGAPATRALAPSRPRTHYTSTTRPLGRQPEAAAAHLGVVEAGVLESSLRVDLQPSDVRDAGRARTGWRRARGALQALPGGAKVRGGGRGDAGRSPQLSSPPRERPQPGTPLAFQPLNPHQDALLVQLVDNPQRCTAVCSIARPMYCSLLYCSSYVYARRTWSRAIVYDEPISSTCWWIMWIASWRTTAVASEAETQQHFSTAYRARGQSRGLQCEHWHGAYQ